MREGRTAAQLVHPNICHVYEFGKWQGDFFIAMEFIDGVALRDVLAQMERSRVRMSPVLAAGIAAQVAGALEYAHNARDARRRPLGVVHLDVTPQNIMLRHDGSVKLLDFGVAQVIDPQADSRSDTVKGKTGYMAPEQVLQKPLDARVDVFCLGICLFEMLSGTRLFKRENLKASLVALLKEPVPSLHALRSDVAPELDAIVHKALALDVESRFQSAGELQAALEGFVARSRQVVSNRHVATLMEHLFPEARSQAPTLYTGPDVLARLASVEPAAPESAQQSLGKLAEPPLASETEDALPTTSVVTGSGIVVRAPYLRWVALFCLAVALGVGGWWSTREAVAVTSVRVVKSRAGSGPEQERGSASAHDTPVQLPVPTSPALALPSQAEAPEPAQPEEPMAQEPAPVAAPSPGPAQGSASKNGPPRLNKRRSSPGFVADPGF